MISEGEGLSIVWMEAFQAGLPIVATKVGSAPEFISNDSGILVAPDKVEALAAALARLVTDVKARRTMADNGLRRVHELCDQARQLRALRELLERLTRRANS